MQSRLDPKAGIAEHLLSEGFAILREEVWWTPGYDRPGASAAATTSRASAQQSHRRSTGSDASVTRDGDDSEQPFPALKRLLADRERFVAAEQSAQLAKRGLWQLPHEKTEAVMGRDAVVSSGWKERSATVFRALVSFFGRGKQ